MFKRCPSGSPEPYRDIKGFAVAHDGDADGITRAVLFDFVQELFDAAHPFMFHGNDEVGGFAVERPANDSGAIRSTRMRIGWMPA